MAVAQRQGVAGRGPVAADAKFVVDRLSVGYGRRQDALTDVSLAFGKFAVTALIGPSGCGKTTLLRTLNRMNDLVPGCHHTGDVDLDGVSIFDPSIDVVELRRRVGMVFQRPNPFPMSILDNVTFGPRHHGIGNRTLLLELAEESLRAAAIWDEVKDQLSASALGLSGGQQQRLCIARALAVKPEVLLMDEPTGGLDPISTEKVEELVTGLSQRYTVILVTHSLSQAGRVADSVAFVLAGRLIEAAPAREMFTRPKDPRTEAYLTGRLA